MTQFVIRFLSVLDLLYLHSFQAGYVVFYYLYYWEVVSQNVGPLPYDVLFEYSAVIPISSSDRSVTVSSKCLNTLVVWELKQPTSIQKEKLSTLPYTTVCWKKQFIICRYSYSILFCNTHSFRDNILITADFDPIFMSMTIPMASICNLPLNYN